MVLTA